MRQEDKVFLNLAGEFAVASELNRRHLLASVTYGPSKSADIFVMDPSMARLVRVEVKTTNKRKWPVGEKIARSTSFSSDDPVWVLVQMPEPLDAAPRDDAQRGNHSPRYFVLTSREIHEIWRKEAEPYRKRYRAKHGQEIRSIGVPNVSLTGVQALEGRWDKITSRLDMEPATGPGANKQKPART